MPEMSAANENVVTPEDLSNTAPANENPVDDPVSTKPRTKDEICADAQTSDQLLLSDLHTTKQSAPQCLELENEDRRDAADAVESVVEEIPVKIEPDDGELPQEFNIKEEFQQSEGDTLVGKVKIKPLASLLETSAPNPQPGVHPFFAGFDDHIRSVITNRQPHFAMNPPLIQRPTEFMYYDNSTNMNLKKMLNGNKIVQIPFSRHPTSYRPYVPINIPRPPRSQVPFRITFSTQTPVLSGSETDPATPSSSYQWPQSRPPVSSISVSSIQYFTPQSTLDRNLMSPKNLSNATASPPSPKYNATHSPSPNANKPSNPKVKLDSRNVAPPQSNKVSTSSNTDDIEKHSSGNAVIIKTEVDLGIDSKEQLQEALNENMGNHFMDLPGAAMQTDSATPNLEIPDTKPSPILTGDAVGRPKEVVKPEYELPSYSTKGCLLCKCCDFRCNRKKKMKEHFETMHTAENSFKCFYCVKKQLAVFPHKTVHDLEHHVGKVHRGERRWQCKYCSKSYKCHSSYRAHMENTCSQSHPYACHMCTFTCVTENALEKHIKSHEKIQETVLCPFCQKKFKKLYLKQHLITVHAPPEEKPFHCDACDFATGSQSVLENHYKRTGHDKQVKCDHCDYACRSVSIMKHHMQGVHDKDDPNRLVCGVDGCQVKFKNVASARVHRRMHSMSESELFKCPDKECSMKFASEQGLRLHTAKTKHHKPFKCPDCVSRFIKEESLNRHIQSVHVPRILQKMEKGPPKEPVCVKNVVDVYKYVEGLGGVNSIQQGQSQMDVEEDGIEEDGVSSFGCWLGISGFGDTPKTDCDNIIAPQTNSGMSEYLEGRQVGKIDEEDKDYHDIVPITCLVEVKQEETENMFNSSVEKTQDGETLGSVKEEDEEEAEYQYVNPEVSCLVECQENSTMDSSVTNYNDPQECSPDNLVKIEVEEAGVP